MQIPRAETYQVSGQIAGLVSFVWSTFAKLNYRKDKSLQAIKETVKRIEAKLDTLSNNVTPKHSLFSRARVIIPTTPERR